MDHTNILDDWHFNSAKAVYDDPRVQDTVLRFLNADTTTGLRPWLMTQ